MLNNWNVFAHWKRLAAVMTLSALLLMVSQNAQAKAQPPNPEEKNAAPFRLVIPAPTGNESLVAVKKPPAQRSAVRVVSYFCQPSAPQPVVGIKLVPLVG